MFISCFRYVLLIPAIEPLPPMLVALDPVLLILVVPAMVVAPVTPVVPVSVSVDELLPISTVLDPEPSAICTVPLFEPVLILVALFAPALMLVMPVTPVVPDRVSVDELLPMPTVLAPVLLAMATVPV